MSDHSMQVCPHGRLISNCRCSGEHKAVVIEANCPFGCGEPLALDGPSMTYLKSYMESEEFYQHHSMVQDALRYISSFDGDPDPQFDSFRRYFQAKSYLRGAEQMGLVPLETVDPLIRRMLQSMVRLWTDALEARAEASR